MTTTPENPPVPRTEAQKDSVIFATPEIVEDPHRNDPVLHIASDSKPKTTKTNVTQNAEENLTATTGGEGKGFSARWTGAINTIHGPIMKGLLWTSGTAARNPRKTVAGVTFLSFFLLIVGFLTNFSVDVDEDVLWTPENARPVKQGAWISTAGYPEENRDMLLFFHANTENVLGQAQTRKVFTALDTVRNLPGYRALCAQSSYVDPRTGQRTCEISGATAFWNDTAALFESQVDNDNDAIQQLSAPVYPDGTPVSDNDIFGKPLRNEVSRTLESAQAYVLVIGLPDTEETEDFELEALDAILDLRNNIWNGNEFNVEVTTQRSFSDEFTRGIVRDIPLVPTVFIIMSIFTCIVFAKRDKVRSRSLLGLSATICVLLSIMSGYGLLFIAGVPFTSMTQILPFIIFGIGLDDAFIVSGAYERTDPAKNPVDRIEATIEDVGASITLTTITSTFAFGLGASSDVPSVYWLCYYAFPTVMLVFLYQITFFVATIVLDEERICANRRDCCIWVTVQKREGTDEDVVSDVSHTDIAETVNDTRVSPVDYWMGVYSRQLLRPAVKVFVVLFFCGLLGACAYSATKLTQEFKFTEVLPDDSYLSAFQFAFDDNTFRSAVAPYAYFRFVDQSDPMIQAQMESYVNELVSISAIEEQPSFFWLRDFQLYRNETGLTNTNNTMFASQVQSFLSTDVFAALYQDDIVLDDTGNIVTSRVRLNMDNVDLEDVNEQIKALDDQAAVTAAQPVNQQGADWSFFSYDSIFNIWEFYAASVDEVIFTTVMGISAVTVLTLLFVPHWTAALFILPIICVLYVDLLGVMQWAGVHINAVSYITLVMSIGLTVDFILHVLLRYYESPGNREEKTLYTLQTMGTSVLIGGVSTFLGTLPLAFSTSEIFYTVFVSFIGLVTLGCGHGLILLPVLLSTIGPEDQIWEVENRAPATEIHEALVTFPASEEDKVGKELDTE
jgi:Niemann-Pick C1 protein